MDGPVEPPDIEPVGAFIAVAFTGAVIGFAGFLLSLFARTSGLAVLGLGLLVIVVSPAAYVRFKNAR